MAVVVFSMFSGPKTIPETVELQMRLIREWAHPLTMNLRFYTYKRYEGELLSHQEYYERITRKW